MDEYAVELVRDWMTRASHDLRVAALAATVESPPLDIAIYHCQQAAEKSIKGWLQGKDTVFPSQIPMSQNLGPPRPYSRRTRQRTGTPAVRTSQCQPLLYSRRHCNMLKPFMISC
jgi:hypothetical protein